MFASSRARRWVAAVSLVFLCTGTGCVEKALRERGELMDYEPIAPTEPVVPKDGSIFQGRASSGSYLFFDSKARKPGDLVTIMIVEQTQAEGDASTELESERTMAGTLSSDIGLTALVTKPAKKILGFFGFGGEDNPAAAGAETNVVTSSMTNDFSGEGKTSRSGKFTGVVTCRVVDVLPSGILHVRGRRWVVINHDAQYLTIEGLVRPEDLSINNTVTSNFVAEMSLSYDGLGVIDDKQRPGWVARIFDWIYPL
ncbi:MAG: flagellar basal body L-ring protein FlgH [Myxococcota bacterium]|nr:flagellar basal body L-ring protein FlgH [Myxococcota bacterium]